MAVSSPHLQCKNNEETVYYTLLKINKTYSLCLPNDLWSFIPVSTELFKYLNLETTFCCCFFFFKFNHKLVLTKSLQSNIVILYIHIRQTKDKLYLRR